MKISRFPFLSSLFVIIIKSSSFVQYSFSLAYWNHRVNNFLRLPALTRLIDDENRAPLKQIIAFPSSTPNPSYKQLQERNIEIDTHFMRMALEEAKKAASKNEVPIGAVIVRPIEETNHSHLHMITYEILSRSYNQVECSFDATAHAENLALRAAARSISNWRLCNTTLYTTLEPCITCMAAAHAFRIDRIVYGAKDFRLGAVNSWIDWNGTMPNHPYHPNGIKVDGGVLEQECGKILIHFFRNRRKGKHQNGHDKSPASCRVKEDGELASIEEHEVEKRSLSTTFLKWMRSAKTII